MFRRKSPSPSTRDAQAPSESPAKPASSVPAAGPSTPTDVTPAPQTATTPAANATTPTATPTAIVPPEQPGVRAESGARPGPFAGIPPSAPARRPYEFPSTAPTARLAPPRPIDTRPEPEPVGRSEEERGNRLFVGRDISLTGQITSCASLHVEGRVQATLSESHKLEIGESGQFIGTADVQEGDISGVFDGELTVNRLVIRRKGRVTGRIRYGTLQVEEGGRLLGDIQEIGTASDSAATTPPVPANTPVEGAAS